MFKPYNGATVTVFAPYDCKNNCPFCINKKEYKDNPIFDIDKLKQSMVKLDGITPKCDFVFTGGEPLADIDKLSDLLDLIRYMNSKGSSHKLFINTTLPNPTIDIIDRLNSYADVITGFNISRHIRKYVDECDDSFLNKLTIPIRINCVLYKPSEAELALNLINRFGSFKNINGFQFRDNYIGVDETNLYNMEDNEVFSILKKVFNCPDPIINKNRFRWNAKLGDNIFFHRTQCFSKLNINGEDFIGDVIINPRGEIFDDWNEHGSLLNLEEYEKAKEI